MGQSIGDRLRRLRIARDLTLESVAEQLGITKQTMHKYERGIITSIPLDKIEQLAEIYETEPDEIVGWANADAGRVYLDPETQTIAESIHQDKELQMLFSVAKDVSPENLKLVHELVKSLRRKELGDD